jgi:hypothetical protein
MPTSAKPRRRGNHLRLKRTTLARPLPHEVDLVFRPLDLMFAQLRAGEIDAVQGRPVFRSFEGELCEVCPALEGWIESWRLIDQRFGLDIGVKPLETLRRKLYYSIPLETAEVDAAWATVCAERVAYAQKLDVHKVKSIVRTAEIKLEMESIHG